MSEPSIATATTIIVAIEKDMNVLSPENSMPAIAIRTVTPEISTARPEVAAAASSAALLALAGRTLFALTPEVEERVVDADGEADQQDDSATRLVDRDKWLGSAMSPIVAKTAESASSSGTRGRDDRPEDEQQDQQRQRDGDHPGGLQHAR